MKTIHSHSEWLENHINKYQHWLKKGQRDWVTQEIKRLKQAGLMTRLEELEIKAKLNLIDHSYVEAIKSSIAYAKAVRG